MSAWRTRRTVRFAHCDPAGIVFYPRFFEIVHDALEDWFRDALGLPFRELIGTRREGFPVVALSTRFLAPSRLGDELDVDIGVPRLGGASLDVRYALSCGGEPRVVILTTIVHTDLATGRPLPIDDDLRGRFERYRIDPEPDAERR
jgi:4-hydroxybenzoyl-CoA thioesterase